MAEGYATRYHETPLMVYWEVTRACDLTCRHCRAAAVARRDPQELTTEEGFRLLDALRRFGEPKPHLVFTGGDPLKRPDIYALAAHAVALGLQVGITPSGTPLLTPEAVGRLRASGVRTVALSLDGSGPDGHDRIRGVAGSYVRTVAAARWIREAGLALQISSLVCAETAGDLPAVHQLVLDLEADRWSVFFLVPIGRGAVLREVTPWECEVILEWLYDRSLESRVAIKTTEAHHFRRIALQRQANLPSDGESKTTRQHGGAGTQRHGDTVGLTPGLRAAHSPAERGRSPGSQTDAIAAMRRGFGIRDGAGIMFVSHTGEVYPAGFLPLSVGSTKTEDPVRLYREAPLFVQLRDPDRLKGRCGRCEFRAICGGSRSRAWAVTGDPLEADPLCAYQPRQWQVARVRSASSAPLAPPQPLPAHGARGG